MKQFHSRYNPILILLAANLSALSLSCTTGQLLSTSGLQDIDAAVEKASFAMILLSSQDQSYLDTVAILNIEGDAYEFEPVAAPFNFTIVEGLNGQLALQTARRFIDYYVQHCIIEQRVITNPASDVIDYELHPL